MIQSAIPQNVKQMSSLKRHIKCISALQWCTITNVQTSTFGMFCSFSSDCKEMRGNIFCSEISNTSNRTICWCHRHTHTQKKTSLTKGECQYKTGWSLTRVRSPQKVLFLQLKENEKIFLLANLPVTRRTHCSLGICRRVMDSPCDMTHSYSWTPVTVFLPTTLTPRLVPLTLPHISPLQHLWDVLKWEILSHECLPDKSAAAAKCCCVWADNNRLQTSPRKLSKLCSRGCCWCKCPFVCLTVEITKSRHYRSIAWHDRTFLVTI